MADQEHLRKFLQGIAEQENYKVPKIDITPVTSDGANYSTNLYVATISEELKPDLHLFAKVANMTEEMLEKNPDFSKAYTVEGLFYSEIALDFERLYNKNNVPLDDRMRIPKYYGHSLTRGSETIVLENLQKRDFHDYDRFKPVNWEYACAALTELARFHAMGIALRHENPVEFEKNIGRLGQNMMFHDQYVQFLANAAEKGFHIIQNEYKLRFQEHCNAAKREELWSAMLKTSNLLASSDFRPSNMMHRRRNGKLELITLDYQTVSLGSPVMDLLYFIFCSSDEEFRRLYYKTSIDHYFTQLSLALKQLNVDVEEVYPRKTFDNDVNELQLFGLHVALGMVPLFLVDPKDAPKEIGSMDGLYVQPNQLAVERLNGIVRDFVKWGVM